MTYNNSRLFREVLMLEPFGSEIIRLFRLLTPHEIDRYIETDVEPQVQKIEGSVVAGGEFNEFAKDEPPYGSPGTAKPFPKEQAKIIPLAEYQKAEGSPVSRQHARGEQSQEDDHRGSGYTGNHEESYLPPEDESAAAEDLQSIGILSASAIKKIENERLKNENKKKDSATIFLLKQRERMRDSKKRLTEQVAMKSYKTSASQEFHHATDEEILDEDYSNDLRGILVNKKQY